MSGDEYERTKKWKNETEAKQVNAIIAPWKERVEKLEAALRGLMPFHPEDELGPFTEDYWSPEYKAAMDAARDALKGGEE